MSELARNSQYPLRDTGTALRVFSARERGFYEAIRAIKETARKIAPTFSSTYVAPRGLAIPVDPWLSGELRWARKIGAAGSVWLPETFMQLDQNTGKGESVFYVHQLPDSLVDGTIIEVSATEKAELLDWDTADFTLTVASAIESEKAEGSFVKVWASPVTMEGGISSGNTQIRVSSALRIARGDRIQIPVDADGSFSYTTSRTVLESDLVEEDAEGAKYLLTLDASLHRDVASDETLYLRAFPAYFSNLVPLPDYSAQYLSIVGPFLVDYLSGPLVAETKAEEYLNVRTYRADRDPLTPMLASSHNGQVNRMPIQADQLLFWNKVDGTINHDGANTICTCDDDGHFRVVQRLRPEMDPPELYATGAITAVATASLSNNEGFEINDGLALYRYEFKVNSSFSASPGKTTIDVSAVTTDKEVAALMLSVLVGESMNLSITRSGRALSLVNKATGTAGNQTITSSVSASAFTVQGMSGGGGDLSWVISAQSDADGTLLVRFHPNADQEYTLTAGGTTTCIVTLAGNDDPATHIDVRVNSDPGAEVKLSTWSLSGSRVAYVEMEAVVQVETDQWAGASLMIKPIWPNLDLLKPYPALDRVDGGGLIL